MALSQSAALWLLPVVFPLCLYVSFSDMKSMKIRNWTVYAIALVFVAIAPWLMPFEQYLWHLAALPVFLVLGIVLNAAGVMGAGDAKFIAAAAPYLAWDHRGIIAILFAAALLGGYGAHRLVKNTKLRNMAPTWESWETGKRFPMGLPLSMTLVFYLGFIALGLLA